MVDTIAYQQCDGAMTREEKIKKVTRSNSSERCCFCWGP